jgi:hypothetical protein
MRLINEKISVSAARSLNRNPASAIFRRKNPAITTRISRIKK